MSISSTPSESLLSSVAASAETSGAFGPVEVRGQALICRAKASGAPASYRLFEEGGRLWVALVMADRWLSESIESDLMHTGDSMEELIAEELAEQGVQSPAPVVEHFRSEDLLFTFRSPLPIAARHLASGDGASTAIAWLLAYEAAFRNLGDMSTAGEA